jgi:Zn-dependent protease/CBS domain-containing protein
MKWSWRFARIAGIGIYVHATFFLLLAWVAIAEYQRGGDVRAVLSALLFILAIFATVVLHELGHALTAAHYGIATRDITLLPIGGVARLERMPREPKQELLVALAGPAVNVVLAALLVGVLAATGAGRSLAELAAPDESFLGREFVARLVAVNIWLALFNLIPAFPMDGGRVLRALLAMRHGDYPRATATAARVGRFFALLFGIVGLFIWNNPFLVFIALFVWLGAAGEAAAVQTSATLDGVSASRVMITDVRTVAPTDSLGAAVRLMLDGFQQDFPVVDRGEVVGVLTRRALIKGLAETGEATPVSAVMQRDFRVSAPDEPVEEALARLRSCNCQALPVVRGRELLGVLTLENVGEYMMVQSALRGEDTRRSGVA